jgi:UDPglucose 6-dehydrogenase
MRVSVIGSGYVGLVAGTCFADTGNDVTCVDINQAKIDGLQQGVLPIYEPGLEELVKKNVKESRLTFTTDLASAVAKSQVVFIAVGTPEGETGDADLQYVLAAARDIGRALTGYTVVVDKSTVPVGTADQVRATIAKETSHPFDVVSNPEFLKEGAALDDFLKPDRVVIGTESEEARALMAELYAPFVRTENPILFMDTRSAELTKYAANAMLATRISFMNDIAALCEKVGADVDFVRKGLGSDSRIGYPFLFPGVGYGGSCLDGRETVLVRRGERVELLSLRRLFDEVAGPRDDDAPGTVAVHPGGLEVHAWTGQGGAFLPVEALTRRPWEGELLEVRTKLGRRVRCTPDHPFVTRDGVKQARELTVDDWLPLAVGAPAGQGDGVVPRFDVLGLAAGRAGLKAGEVKVRVGPEGDARLSALGTTGLEEALAPFAHPRGRSRVYDVLRQRTLHLDEAEQARVPLHDATVGTAKNGTYVPTVIEGTEAFWRVVGLYLAEGHCTADGQRRRLAWSFHPSKEPDLVEAVAGFWRSLGVKADVRRGSTTMQVSLSSRLLAAFWVEGLGLGADSYSHRIPDAAWTLPEAHRRALLEGLWRGDGSWSFVAGGPSVVLEYGTVSRALADGMLRLLAGLGVAARLKVGRTSKSTVDTYWLVVSGADQVERLLELVPEGDRDEVRVGLARQKKRIKPTGSRRDDDGSTWVRVQQVTPRPPSRFVYSLEVPGAQTFVTTAGLVVHNCFPKDVKALVATAREHGLELDLLRAVERTNERQKKLLVQKAVKHYGDLSGKRFAVWGLAFKPKTDDMREAPSVEVIEGLLGKGASVTAFDPVATETAKRVLSGRVTFAPHLYDALQGADGLFVVTEWNEFRHPDWARVKGLMAQAVVFDGRNIYPPAKLRELGFTHYGVGRR